MAVHRVVDRSDTRGVDTKRTHIRESSFDAVGEGADGQLFHVEQFGRDSAESAAGADSGSDVGDGLLGALDRIETMVGGVGDVVGEFVGDGSGERARMFAHEVNGLVAGISGRAQRALMSGCEEQVRVALEMASEVGGRVRVLCDGLMMGDWASKSLKLDRSQVYAAHRFATLVATEYLDIVRVHWVVVVDDTTEVPMGGAVFGQVLMNLYRNALLGVARGLEESSGGVKNVESGRVRDGGGLGVRGGDIQGVVRLRVGAEVGGGVVVSVEDSGVGFGGRALCGLGGIGQSGGGYGLGLGVCRAMCGGYGGRVEIDESALLGGGRVSVIFD